MDEKHEQDRFEDDGNFQEDKPLEIYTLPRPTYPAEVDDV